MYAMKTDNWYMHICDAKELYHNSKYRHICNIHVTSENHTQSCANKYYQFTSYVIQFW